jgi:hypothetical protein
MEVGQVLIPAKCESSTTVSGIKILNLDKEVSDFIAVKDEEVSSVWNDKDLYFCIFGLGSEFSPESKHGEHQHDAITFPELLEHFDFVKSDLSSEVSVKNDQVEEYECEYVAIPFSEVCDYFSLQQGVEECMINNMQEGTEKIEIYDEVYNEAWLFGKYFWLIHLLCYDSFSSSNKGVVFEFYSWFSLLKHNPLYRKGSYFSLPVNGHASPPCPLLLSCP